MMPVKIEAEQPLAKHAARLQEEQQLVVCENWTFLHRRIRAKTLQESIVSLGVERLPIMNH
jgi:hypothetical protein